MESHRRLGISVDPLLASFLVVISLVSTAGAVTVTTKVGKIAGTVTSFTLNGQSLKVTKFLGIPYGESTAGTNRFRKPVPESSFSSLFHAVHLPPSCDPSSSNFSENCLFLNIFVPNDFVGNASLPVMIYIHGGGFQSGSSRTYHGEMLSAFGDVIVVTINYRLGLFGFLHSSDGLIGGNFGLWDQHMAIKWVHDNIASFQGDPNLITIFGESAGSKSVIYQSLYTGNKDLFIRAIGESGSAESHRAINLNPNADEVISKAGCPAGLSGYSCLRSKPVDVLRHIHIIHPELKFLPTVDGDFVVEKPYDIMFGNLSKSFPAKQFFASIDILSGVNMYDGALFLISTWPKLLHQSRNNMTVNKDLFKRVVVPWIVTDAFPGVTSEMKTRIESTIFNFYTKSTDPELRVKVVDVTSDMTYFRSTIKTVIAHTQLHGGRTYLYEFAVEPTYHALPTPVWLKGANHADDVAYVFGKPVSPYYSHRANYSTEDVRASRAMMTLWTNFAKSGNPNHPNDVTRYLNTTWPEYNVTSRAYLRLTNQLSTSPVQHGFHEDRMRLWLETIPAILSGGAFNPVSGIIGKK